MSSSLLSETLDKSHMKNKNNELFFVSKEISIFPLKPSG